MSSKNLPVKSIQTIEQFYDERGENLAALLPADVSLDFMKANVIAAVSANPKLLDCTRSSLFRSVFEAHELGLMVHSSLGEAWIVPYKNQATFIPGYQGLTKLAYNAGFVKRIESRTVFSNDDFRCTYGIDGDLYLREALPNRGELRGVYCLVELMTGGNLYDFYHVDKLEEIRGRSASYRFKGDRHEIWGNEHNRLEMYRKAVWLNVSKWIPRSGTRYTRALDIDSHDYEEGYWESQEDAAERLYLSVGASGSEEKPTVKRERKRRRAKPTVKRERKRRRAKPSVKPTEDPREAMKGEIERVYDKPEEFREIQPYMLAMPGENGKFILGTVTNDIDESEAKQIATIMRHVQKQLNGRRLSEQEGCERVLRFYRYCVLNQYVINNTTNAMSAITSYRAYEREDEPEEKKEVPLDEIPF